LENLNLKKFFLYLLIASVACSALLGIGVVLLGNFGETESKILLTTLTVTMTSIVGLACGAYLETKRGEALPVCGIVLAIISAILWTIFIWGGTGNGESFVKFAFSTTLLATACSHISLLSIARLEKKFRWSLYAAVVSDWSLATILLWIIWLEPPSDSGLIARLIGILSILIAALTIITPIFHKLSTQPPDTAEIDAEITRLRARIEELEKQRVMVSNDEK